MPPEVWRSSDLFDLFRSLYTAKLAAVQLHGEGDGGPEPFSAQPFQFYQQGCQMAVQTLLLALGYSPQDFYQADPDETTRQGRGREIWMRTDIGNLIVSIYDTFTSRTDWLPEDSELTDPVWTMRHAGFYDMLAQVLQALGLPAQVLEQDWRPPPPIVPRVWKGDGFDED